MVMFIFRGAYYMSAQPPEKKDQEIEADFATRLLKWEKAQGVAEVIIAKHRHGRTDSLRLHFDADTARFENLHVGPT